MPNDWTPQPPYPFDSPGKVDTPSSRTKRQLLKTAFGTLIVVAASYLGWTQLAAPPAPRSRPGAKPTSHTDAGGQGTSIGTVAQIQGSPQPTAVTVAEQPAYVEFANGQPLVLSAVCPHQGCAVEWQAAANKFVCPCHDSEFARDGSLLQGPSKQPLTRLSCKVDNGTITVEG